MNIASIFGRRFWRSILLPALTVKACSLKLFLILLVAMAPAAEALTKSAERLEFTPLAPVDRFAPGASYRLLFQIDIEEGNHIQSNVAAEGFVSTELQIASPDPTITIGSIRFPPSELYKSSFSEVELPSFEGRIYIGATIAIAPESAPGIYRLETSLTAQACSDAICFPPSTVDRAFFIEIVERAERINPINQRLFQERADLFEATDRSERSLMSAGYIEDYLQNEGLILTLILVFLAGLALNLTPCVYPLIPITISYFATSSSAASGSALLARAGLYVGGMALVYSTLGLIAGLSGGFFGAILQSSITQIALTLFMLGMAGWMFDLYQPRLPAFALDLGGKNRAGYLGALIMGMTVGIVASPCVGPFSLGLLAYVGSTRDPALGFALFFVLALGLGVPFLLLAVFSGLGGALPRPGAWMILARSVFGVILLYMALYFAEPLIGAAAQTLLFAAISIGAAVYLGFVLKVELRSFAARSVRMVIALGFVSIAGFALASGSPSFGAGVRAPDWIKPSDLESIERALVNGGKPSVIDFWASWCLPCKELDRFTFSDERLIEYSKGFQMIKIDVSQNSPQTDRIKDRFDARGVPTIIFTDRSGEPIEELTSVGFIDADAALEKMKAAAGAR